MSLTHPPTIRNPGEGRRIGVVGDIYRFLATVAPECRQRPLIDEGIVAAEQELHEVEESQVAVADNAR